MFGRKYIFETKSTRIKRLITSFLLISIISSLIFISFCIYLPLHGARESTLSADAFYRRSPDLIVVFTGDAGRISYAIKKAKESEHTQVLISGVYARNTLKNLLDQYDQEKLSSKQIEIDYLARNTNENVIYSLRFIRSQQVLKKILIISSDYHIFRIQMLIAGMKSEQDDFLVYYQGTTTDYFNWRSIRILMKEGVKVLKSMVFLISWGGDDLYSDS